MTEKKQPIDGNDAKNLLESIEKQKRMTAEAVRMPMWLNIIMSVLVTWIVSADFLVERVGEIGDNFIPFVLFFTAIYFWYKTLDKRGYRPKLLALNTFTIIVFSIGFLVAIFFNKVLIYLHDNQSPASSYLLMLCFACVLAYFGDKYPLSESISKEQKSGY